MSRIGRHNAKTLLFMEELQRLDIIFIAINDAVDTSKEEDNDRLSEKRL